MAYIVNPKHGTLATPYGTWFAGDPFIRPPKFPEDLFKKWIAVDPDGTKPSVLIPDEHGADVEEEEEDEDVLTHLSRSELLLVSKMNGLKDKYGLVIYKSYTEDVIRGLIRDAVKDLSILKLPGAQVEESVE